MKSKRSEWCRCGKWGVMHTNVEYLRCGEVETLGHFQLSDMRYDDRNVVTKRVSTTVLQLYLIWTPAQILEHVIEFQRWLKTPATPMVEFFVTLVDGWRSQTNNTTTNFILDTAIV